MSKRMSPQQIRLSNMQYQYTKSHMSSLVDDRSLLKNPNGSKKPTNKWTDVVQSFLSRRLDSSNLSPSSESQGKPLLESDRTELSHSEASEENPARFLRLKHIGPFYHQADPDHQDAQTYRVWRSKRQVVLYACCVFASIVHLINVVVTIVFKTKWHTIGKLGVIHDLGTIYFGDCSKSNRLNLYLHVVINILSTMLLATSNLCMQLLVAPTRKEVDQAHEKLRWLDIGVPSLRNLRHISPLRRTFAFLLATSSIPLHFL